MSAAAAAATHNLQYLPTSYTSTNSSVSQPPPFYGNNSHKPQLPQHDRDDPKLEKGFRVMVWLHFTSDGVNVDILQGDFPLK